MPVLVPLVVAIPFIFAGWVVHRALEHRARMRQLTIPALQQPMAALPASDRAAFEQRIANLEAIVCSDEFAFQRSIRERDAA
ncbi:MAG: hypothetical protein KUG77_18360 [Nannocystaceae bacterium]|nr:hypothetical protein [Nannocystaceae bacterium]